jgi:hypothetical protein
MERQNFWVRVIDADRIVWAFIEERCEGYALVWSCGRDSAVTYLGQFDSLEAAVGWIVDEGFEPLWEGALSRALPPPEILRCKASSLLAGR